MYDRTQRGVTQGGTAPAAARQADAGASRQDPERSKGGTCRNSCVELRAVECRLLLVTPAHRVRSRSRGPAAERPQPDKTDALEAGPAAMPNAGTPSSRMRTAPHIPPAIANKSKTAVMSILPLHAKTQSLEAPGLVQTIMQLRVQALRAYSQLQCSMK